MPRLTVAAVVLAGGRNVTWGRNPPCPKACLPLGSGIVLDRVVDALNATQAVSDVVVVGDVPKSKRYFQVDPARTIDSNVKRGVREVMRLHGGPPDYYLIASGDMPSLKTVEVQLLLEAAQRSSGDICYPVIPAHMCTNSGKRTTFRLGGIPVPVTGGNIFVVKHCVIHEHNLSLLRAIYEDRKQPNKLAKRLGYWFAIRFLLTLKGYGAFLTQHEVEQRCSRILAAEGKILYLQTPGIGCDLDTEAHYTLLQQSLATR